MEINFEVVVPVVIIFAMIRFSKLFKITTRSLSGIRFFTTKRFIVPSNAQTKNVIDIETALTKMNLTMMEVKDLPEVVQLLGSTPFFDSFETLIQLSMALIGFYIWSLARCVIFPESVAPSGWTTLATVAIVLLCFQALLTVFVLTGLRAVETRLALLVGFWTAILLTFVDIVPELVLNQAGAHGLGLLRQLSPRIPELSSSLGSSLAHGWLVVALTIFTTIMTFPALRFTQTLQQLTMGREFERAKHWATKTLVWLDNSSPLLVILAFNPSWWSLELSEYRSCVEETCPNVETQSTTQKVQQLLQIFSLGWLVMLKLLSGRRHLQAFMDVSVQAVSQVLIAKDAEQVKLLRGMIEARSRYLMAAATQWMVTAALFLSLFVTFLRCVLPPLVDPSSAIVVQSPLLSQAILELNKLWLSNTTQLATEHVGQPYFEEAFFALLGALPKDASLEVAEASRGAWMQAFLVKMQQIHPLPGSVAVPFMQGVIFWATLLWFALNVLALAVWVLSPSWFQKTVSDSQNRA